MKRHNAELCSAAGRGATALVTGASSGIGAVFADRLAARGYRPTLVARRRERMLALADDLRRRHGVAAEVLVADLADPLEVEQVARWVEADESIELLVNNAGFGSASAFARGDLEQLDMIAVHVVASVRLSRAALIHMLARGHGAIVNVASIAAFLPAAGNVTYTASKAFLKVFSECLAAEVAGTGVRVQALCPGFTYTEFYEPGAFVPYDPGAVPAPFWMSAERVVETSLRGLDRGQVVCIPGALNRMAVALLGSRAGAPLRRAVIARLRRAIADPAGQGRLVV